YGYDPVTNTLAGSIWVAQSVANTAGVSVNVYYSDANGIFDQSQPFLVATFSSVSLVSGYNMFSFSGNPVNGGVGMHFYIRAGVTGKFNYDTNGGDWYHYRVFPPRLNLDLKQWKGRAVYQIMTDRFARPISYQNPFYQCTDYTNYCGGNWQGIIDRLDYIYNMGFDAIWISPINDNMPKGYHGYWPRDFTIPNSNFGSETTLHNLVDAVHARNMSIMFDMVVNHMGPGPTGNPSDYPAPLNNGNNFHSNCVIDFTKNPDQGTVEYCRVFYNLPDLNTEDYNTQQWLYKTAGDIVSKYKPDGLRIDTFRHIPKTFWPGFQSAINNTFAFGEVAYSDTGYVAAYQNVCPSLANYPTYSNVISPVFGYQNDMSAVTNQVNLNQQAGMYKDFTVLGTFADNQDQPRVLTLCGN
ncbi:hypothetical protein HDU76_009740, partial [Blyttiomyces sp. JEL0837]